MWKNCIRKGEGDYRCVSMEMCIYLCVGAVMI